GAGSLVDVVGVWSIGRHRVAEGVLAEVVPVLVRPDGGLQPTSPDGGKDASQDRHPLRVPTGGAVRARSGLEDLQVDDGSRVHDNDDTASGVDTACACHEPTSRLLVLGVLQLGLIPLTESSV